MGLTEKSPPTFDVCTNLGAIPEIPAENLAFHEGKKTDLSHPGTFNHRVTNYDHRLDLHPNSFSTFLAGSFGRPLPSFPSPSAAPTHCASCAPTAAYSSVSLWRNISTIPRAEYPLSSISLTTSSNLQSFNSQHLTASTLYNFALGLNPIPLISSK